MLLAAVIVVVDVLFFKHRIWARLVTNIGIALVFIVFYVLVLRRR